MAEYTITKVSSNPPREWSFQDKQSRQTVAMVSYKVMLGGIDEPVDINRKAGSDAPKVGELLTGSIVDGEFGQRFKPERKAFTPNAAKDQDSIRAQWAIGQAVQVSLSAGAAVRMSEVEANAKVFFSMVERVKKNQASGYDKFKEQGEKLKTTPADEVFPVTEEPVNLADIPF